MADHLGISWDGWLPDEKKGIKPRNAAAELLENDPDLRRRMQGILRHEADLLGYKL
jgi:hypothetical protein